MREELAWAAGFFDGEGSTSFIAGKNLLMAIKQKDRRNLERFLDAVGDGRIFGPYQHKGETCITYRWAATNMRAVRAMQQIEPWLGPAKSEQFDRAREKWDQRLVKKRAARHGPGQLVLEGGG